MDTLATTEVCDLLGVSYRRLHYLTELRVVPEGRVGSGAELRWSADTVDRLRVALALEAAASLSTSQWPAVAAATMAGPVPPAHGWVALVKGCVVYAASPVDLLADVAETGTGAVIACLA